MVTIVNPNHIKTIDEKFYIGEMYSYIHDQETSVELVGGGFTRINLGTPHMLVDKLYRRDSQSWTDTHGNDHCDVEEYYWLHFLGVNLLGAPCVFSMTSTWVYVTNTKHLSNHHWYPI